MAGNTGWDFALALVEPDQLRKEIGMGTTLVSVILSCSFFLFTGKLFEAIGVFLVILALSLLVKIRLFEKKWMKGRIVFRDGGAGRALAAGNTWEQLTKDVPSLKGFRMATIDVLLDKPLESFKIFQMSTLRIPFKNEKGEDCLVFQTFAFSKALFRFEEENAENVFVLWSFSSPLRTDPRWVEIMAPETAGVGHERPCEVMLL